MFGNRLPNDNLYPYGKLQYILHQLNLDWLVKQVKENTEDIEELQEHSGGVPTITADASVDETTGTPSVTVSRSGTDLDPHFTFAFSNIKGERGETGATGATGERGPQGERGLTGETGERGPQGMPGVQGETGPAGQTGPAGSDGTPAYASVTKSGDTATITCTDANGTTTATVSDGATGSTGATGARGSDFWKTNTQPTFTSSKYRFALNKLTGVTGDTPRVGDVIFYSIYYYVVTEVDSTYAWCTTRTSIQGPAGPQGPSGPSGGLKVFSTDTAPTQSAGSYEFSNGYLIPNPYTSGTYPDSGDVIFYNGYIYYVDNNTGSTAICSTRVEIASGGGGGGGGTSVTFTPNTPDINLYNDIYGPSLTADWELGKPIVLQSTTGSGGNIIVGSISDSSLTRSGLAIIYPNGIGQTATSMPCYYNISSGSVHLNYANLQYNSIIVLF